MTKYNPVNGIIIIRIDRRDTSAGGIALVNKEKLDYGTIVATGPGEYLTSIGLFIKFTKTHFILPNCDTTTDPFF